MVNRDCYSRLLKYQKTASDNAFDLLEVMQDNSGKLLENTLEKCPWLPKFGKDGCLYWSKGLQQTTSSVRSLFDRGYSEAEKLFPGTEKSKDEEVKTSPKKNNPAKPGVNSKKKSGRAKTGQAKVSAGSKKTAVGSSKAEPDRKKTGISVKKINEADSAAVETKNKEQKIKETPAVNNAAGTIVAVAADKKTASEAAGVLAGGAEKIQKPVAGDK
ncbi:hypothetical protein [Desulforhopalus singaporensis]|uniref:Uncharacterized protein n=1 Tax=Desulforhopalus singaporensis TaxID=91360 RepID=A0A1H0J1Z0_9BACT|nr:hypothetical protein [Desulforhopalus singaporensis]SDO37757.1 hypothetical protein SAMN05660330_00117 [Desulforhopalus singaporensis]